MTPPNSSAAAVPVSAISPEISIDKLRALPPLSETHPNSRKVGVGEFGVPMREVALDGG